ncbi:hypothetical protein, partial [Gluconacetobacter entanii]
IPNQRRRNGITQNSSEPRGFSNPPDYWMSRITPPASKGFALYSCLRATGNATPSAVIFVDPPEQPTRQPVEIPHDQVRRRNYAAWLRAMGLTETAQALLESNRDGRREIRLPLIQIGPFQFACTVSSGSNNAERWLGMGLEVSVLNAISAALDGKNGPLLAYDGLDIAMEEIEFGSIFPDGSYFGMLDVNANFVGYQNFLL